MRMKTISVLYCLLYAAWIEGAEIYVEGLEGGEVSFRCSHKLAWNYDKYLCKNTCSVSENILVTVHSGRRVESGRITLEDSGDGVFTVTFSHLQLSDSGRYWCGVNRPGWDTFTEVQLTVEKAPYTAAANLTTGVPELEPDLSSTWTFENISNSTQSTSVMGTSTPANLSTASNSTNGGEQNNSTGYVLYATVGAAAVLTLLLLAVIVRKRRENSKPQPQVCSNSNELVSADEREADCEYDDIGEEVQSIKTLSELSCTHHPKQDPPTAAESSVPFHIYENIGLADSRHSAAHIQHKQDLRSGIYIRPLPPEKTGEGCDSINTPTATTNARERPRSLWFGLDLSGTV